MDLGRYSGKEAGCEFELTIGGGCGLSNGGREMVSTAEFNQILGNKIKMLREIKGVTQVQLQAALGYDNKSMISYIETGVRGMGKDKVLAAAAYFGVPPAVLLNPVRMDKARLENEVNLGIIDQEGDSETRSAVYHMLKMAVDRIRGDQE